MLNEWIKVAYQTQQKQDAQEKLHALLQQLPVDTLYKLASGELTKEAFLCSSDSDGPKAWIDRFKGTPLFEQAIALEQEEIQVEMASIEKRQQKNIEDDHTSSIRDQLRLKRKLLELQAAQSEVTGQPPPPPAEAQGAGAPGPETPNPEKTVTASVSQVKMAEDMGRSLARSDFEKQAFVSIGDKAGRYMAKSALDMKALGQTAMGLAKAHPGAAIGAGIGAAGGLASGLRKDEHGQRHLLSGVAQGAAGAVAGGAAGHVAQNTHSLMGQGLNLKDAATTSAQAMGNQIKSHATNLASKLMPTGS